MLENTQVYQWLKTDKAGSYVYEQGVEEDDGITYITFTDGSRANAELLGDWIIKVEDEDDGYIIEEEIINDMTQAKLQSGEVIEVPGLMHGTRKVNMKKKPRKSTAPNANMPGHRKPPPPPKPKVESDPVVILLEKAAKQKHTYNVELNVDAISKELFKVVKDTFDDGEEKSLEYIVSLIDVDKLKEQLKEKLKGVYNE